MKLNDFVNKTYQHPVLGQVKVLKPLPKSRTRLEVKITDRGPGYNASANKYTGVKLPTGWMRGENYDHGKIDETHYKDLMK